MTDLRGRIKPKVTKLECGCWEAVITRGYEGNYEHETTYWDCWRFAYDFAWSRVRRWRS